MIDPKELRAGNLIYWNIPEKLNVPHEIVGVLQNRVQTIPMSLGASMEEYSPIPLTPEWLERFGIPYDGQTSSEAYWYNRANKYLCEDYSEGDGGTHLIAECLYVHQLQNLYFALTGKELELKQ